MTAYTTNLTLGAGGYVSNTEIGETASIAGLRTRGNSLATLVSDGVDTILAGDQHATIKDDAMVYDLTVNGVNRLRFSGFTQFDLGEGNDVLDLTVQPRNAASAWTTAVIANGGNGNDVIWSGSGRDTLNGDAGLDKIWGGAGDDTLNGGNDADVLRGAAGLDILNGGAGGDELFGGNDDDTLNGDAGADTLRGEDGNDTLNGGTEADQLFGGIGNDTLNGEAGNDILRGEDDNDTLNGGSGNDQLFGSIGTDTLNGAANVDALDGGDGADFVDGGADDDRVHGGAGDDIVTGGAGGTLGQNSTTNGVGATSVGPSPDRVWGDEGADRFLRRTTDGGEVVMDFVDGVDKILYQGNLATTLRGNVGAFSFDGTNYAVGSCTVFGNGFGGSFITVLGVAPSLIARTGTETIDGITYNVYS